MTDPRFSKNLCFISELEIKHFKESSDFKIFYSLKQHEADISPTKSKCLGTTQVNFDTMGDVHQYPKSFK